MHVEDEVLPEPPRSALLRTAARRRIVTAAAVALLAGGIGARIATTRERHADPAASAPALIVAVDPVRDVPLYPFDPSVCPSSLRCAAGNEVPDAVRAAVTEHAPGAGAMRVNTVGVLAHQRSGGGVWFRQLDAVSGPVRIEVVVKQAVPDAASAPKETVTRFGGTSIGFVRVDVGFFAVSAQFTGPAGYHPPMPAIRALAADPRLLQLG